MNEMYKQIKDLPLKQSIDGTEDVLIQSNGVTMRVKANQVKSTIDLSNYYTKSQVDDLLANLNVEVDMANYYDKTSIDTLLSQYATKVDLNKKVDKTDNALNTTDKTVVGAINELFQSVNNGKNRLEAAIIDVGGTVSKSGSIATFDEIINAISKLSYVPIALNSIKVLKDNWKFKLINNTANTSYSSTDEAQNIYDDSTWKSISTPHDWSIYNSFNSSSASTYEGGYLDGGDAWYRRKLNTLDLSNQKVYLYFDGIYMESDVYVNGVKVISNKWYNPFCVEITDYLNFNSNDTLAIFVRNQQPSSRWYSGSGIIRNVYLVTGNDVEVGLHDVKITYPNLETEYNSDVNTVIDLTIKNKNLSTETYTIKNTLYYNELQVVSKEEELVLTGSESQSFTTNLVINKPNLWDEYAGNLYTLKTEIFKNNRMCYKLDTKFGYRYFKFDKDTGFWLNGKNIKLRGVCLHHDLGCIGAEVNRSGIERQLNLLIDMGANAIRVTHNPGSSELLDLCAEKGLLVVEEFFDCWTSSKKRYDFARYYNDNYEKVIETTVKRGINNPSIIMWSIGNEIIRTSSSYTSEQATTLVNNMKTKIKSLDTTRMVTMGEDVPDNTVARACMELMDVVGVNYGSDSEYHSLRNAYPNFKLYGSETTSALSSRGVYARDAANKQCSSFDDDYTGWGDPASTALKRHMDNDYLAGMFIWTGFDYIGEPTPFNAYPTRSSYFGIIDLAGFPKDIYYMYQSRWTNDPMIHILPHWDDSSATKVWLYSNCNSVELFLNGTSLGKKQQTEIGTKYQFEYNPTYVKGTLVANGYNSAGEIVAQDVVYTSLNVASSIRLKSDKSSVNINSDDLIFITCDVLDSNGNIIPNADNEVTFSVEGGTVIGTDNGDATCITKMRTNIKKAFNGKLLCVVKHDGLSGTLVVKANSNGLPEQTISITKSDVTLLNNKEQTIFIDASNPPIYDYNIPCTSISLNKTSLSFTDSVAQNLIATPLPSNTSDSIIWSVTPTGIVKVDNGLVSPLSNGEATITVTCGSQSATCNVLVNVSSAGGFFDGVAVVSDYTCDGTSFSHELPSDITPLTSTIFVYMNIGSSRTVNSNLISYGPNIGEWRSLSFHMYYKAGGQLMIQGGGVTICSFNLGDTNDVKLAINSNGIVINGNNINIDNVIKFGEIINSNIGTWSIGSTEGNIRSTATYNTIGYYTSLKTTEEMIALTTIHKQEMPSGSVYSLTSETSFNGTSDFIDTNVKLFDTQKDFTLFIDFANASPQNNVSGADFTPIPVLHCIKEVKPWPGIDLSLHTHAEASVQDRGTMANGNKYGVLVQNLNLGLDINDTERHKIIIKKVNSDSKVYIYDEMGLVGNISGVLVTNTFDKNLLIGCYQDDSGNKGRYWKGTVYSCYVYEKALTDSEISAILNITL